MHSSGENSRKRKNDSAKRGEYRNFDQMSSQMRDTLIESYAEKVIAHAAENGGRCRLGFVKELVGMVSQRAPLLEITRDDINNRVRIIKGQRKEEEQRDVSPAIPFHIIRDPSLSTNSDLSVSASQMNSTLGTKLIPHWLATDGFEISAREIPKSGPRSHKSMHETVKIIAIMQHSSKCMPNVKMAWLHQEMP